LDASAGVQLLQDAGLRRAMNLNPDLFKANMAVTEEIIQTHYPSWRHLPEQRQKSADKLAIAHTFHTKNIDAAIEHAKNMEHGTHGSAKLDKFRWKQVPTVASKANVIMIIPDKEAELDTQRWALHDPGPGGVYGIMEVEG